MALVKDIATFLESHKDLDPDELRKMFIKSLKVSHPSTSQLNSDFREIIKKHNTIPLNKLKKCLVMAFDTEHGDSPPMPVKRKESMYNVFMKDQSKLLAIEMPNATQRKRMEEIGRRWQIHKTTLGATPSGTTFAAKSSRTSDTETVSPPRKRVTREPIGTPATRVTRAGRKFIK
jgi:hypothetical protein